MKIDNLVFLRDIRKKKLQAHTIESATIFSLERPDGELTLDELECVVGGMDIKRFSLWRSKLLNEKG
jgi:hypothetical protein